jgi:hypothetical protein
MTCQHQEGSLKGVFHVLFMMQNLPAGTPDQSAVALHQGGEGSFVSAGSEALQELSVAQLTNACRTDHFADMLDNPAKLRLRHF